MHKWLFLIGGLFILYFFLPIRAYEIISSYLGMQANHLQHKTFMFLTFSLIFLVLFSSVLLSIKAFGRKKQ